MAVEIRKSLLSSVLIFFITLFFSFAVDSSQADLRIIFAQHIIQGIDGLEQDTRALNLSRWQRKTLTRRLAFAEFSLDKGIKRFKADQEEKAFKHFKFARFFVNSYLRALSYRVKRGLIDAEDVAPLLDIKAAISV